MTVLLPDPPKKPVPDTVIVIFPVFEPVFVLRAVTVGAGVVTEYLSADEVALVPPGVVTVTSYVPSPSPAGIITPGITLSLDAALNVRLPVPSFTDETTLLPTPPKKPEPKTVIVLGLRFDPVPALNPETTGARAVTVYIEVAVELFDIPPSIPIADIVAEVDCVNGPE